MARTRESERGTAILMTMIIGVALLGGGAVLLGMQLTSTKSAGITKSEITTLNCAESGLAAARASLAANYASWNSALCNPPPPKGTGTCTIGSPLAEPMWLRAPFVPHDLDGNGTNDFVLTLVDNQDEPVDDPTADSDQQIHLISTCVMDSTVKTQLTELLRYDLVTGKLSRKMFIRTE